MTSLRTTLGRFALLFAFLASSVYAEDPSEVTKNVTNPLVLLAYYMTYVFENIVGEGWLTGWILLIVALAVLHFTRVTDSAVVIAVLLLSFLTIYAVGWAQGVLAFIIALTLFYILFNWLTAMTG